MKKEININGWAFSPTLPTNRLVGDTWYTYRHGNKIEGYLQDGYPYTEKTPFVEDIDSRYGFPAVPGLGKMYQNR